MLQQSIDAITTAVVAASTGHALICHYSTRTNVNAGFCTREIDAKNVSTADKGADQWLAVNVLDEFDRMLVSV